MTLGKITVVTAAVRDMGAAIAREHTAYGALTRSA